MNKGEQPQALGHVNSLCIADDHFTCVRGTAEIHTSGKPVIANNSPQRRRFFHEYLIAFAEPLAHPLHEQKMRSSWPQRRRDIYRKRRFGDAMDKIPTTVLTGFLGSGKTTLLNHILSCHDTRRVAVIVNEFGEVGIDGQLVIGAEEDILELNNGCICCTVRSDLTRAVGVPRLAGISYPLGRPLGNPHDADGQRAVLRALLEVLPSATEPDTYVELPFGESVQARSALFSPPTKCIQPC